MSLNSQEKVLSNTPSAIRKRNWREKKPELYLKNNRESNWKLLGIDVNEANHARSTIKSCEICCFSHNKLHVDHNHETGKVRGMLCQKCNFGLGFFEDNIPYLERAIIYLEKNGHQ